MWQVEHKSINSLNIKIGNVKLNKENMIIFLNIYPRKSVAQGGMQTHTSHNSDEHPTI